MPYGRRITRYARRRTYGGYAARYRVARRLRYRRR